MLGLDESKARPHVCAAAAFRVKPYVFALLKLLNVAHMRIAVHHNQSLDAPSI